MASPSVRGVAHGAPGGGGGVAPGQAPGAAGGGGGVALAPGHAGGDGGEGGEGGDGGGGGGAEAGGWVGDQGSRAGGGVGAPDRDGRDPSMGFPHGSVSSEPATS